MHGFQIWLNLPAREKMTPASYQDIPAQELANYTIGGSEIVAISGAATINGESVKGQLSDRKTNPIILDLRHSDTPGNWDIKIPDEYVVLLYVYKGNIALGEKLQPVKPKQLARLSKSGEIRISAEAGTHVLLLAGNPLKEPIVQRGPFVMNTQEEIDQAEDDYKNGRLVS